MALTRGYELIFLAAFCCHAAEFGVIPSDAAKVSPAEAQGFLEMICPGHASVASCEVCPAETPFSAQTWKLRSITFGHFLRPASDDAYVGGFGYEDHAHGFSGAYLFTREGSSWRKVWYTAGENASDCKKLTGSDGRDLLVCEGADVHRGVGDWFLYLLDAGQDPSKREDNTLDIFFGLDDSLGACTKLPDGTVVTGAIESVSFSSASAPHAVRISVTARLGKTATSPVARSCRQSRRYSVATNFCSTGTRLCRTRRTRRRNTLGRLHREHLSAPESDRAGLPAIRQIFAHVIPDAVAARAIGWRYAGDGLASR